MSDEAEGGIRLLQYRGVFLVNLLRRSEGGVLCQDGCMSVIAMRDSKDDDDDDDDDDCSKGLNRAGARCVDALLSPRRCQSRCQRRCRRARCQSPFSV
jgi:hypothetical protein